MEFKKLIEEQNRLECLKNRVELTDYGLEKLAELNQALQLLQTGVINWVAYDWNNPSTRPPKAGRYLIYRSNCDKLHFEQWNGSGWSSSNNDCTHWTLIKPPCL